MTQDSSDVPRSGYSWERCLFMLKSPCYGQYIQAVKGREDEDSTRSHGLVFQKTRPPHKKEKTFLVFALSHGGREVSFEIKLVKGVLTNTRIECAWISLPPPPSSLLNNCPIAITSSPPTACQSGSHKQQLRSLESRPSSRSSSRTTLAVIMPMLQRTWPCRYHGVRTTHRLSPSGVVDPHPLINRHALGLETITVGHALKDDLSPDVDHEFLCFLFQHRFEALHKLLRTLVIFEVFDHKHD